MKNIKKKALILLLCCALLSGCGTTYNQSQEIVNGTFANGYFTTIREWNDNAEGNFRIVYANDTKVKYLVWITGYKASITPLYNKDGSLQIYKEEAKEL